MIVKNGFKLIYAKDGSDVKIGDLVRIQNSNDPWEVTGGEPPKHPGSAGKIWVDCAKADAPLQSRIFYPTIAGMQWILLPPITVKE